MKITAIENVTLDGVMPVLDGRRKYVASTLVSGDAAASVGKLKADEPEAKLVVLGSGMLLRALLAADLIDELQLSIHPLVLGTGTRLFAADGPHLPLALAESVTTTTGVVIATYRRAGA